MQKRLTLVMTLTLVFTLTGSMHLSAATAFADARFQTQWQQGETITPNFWGPLSLAKDGQQEPYKEAQGGQRLGQYFDKGRMELTNGAVTNGLLASELVTGRIQTGDDTFEDRPPPSTPIAGDPDGGGPTYLKLSADFRGFLYQNGSHVGSYLNLGISTGGRLTFYSPDGISAANPTADKLPSGLGLTVTAYDAATQHNVYAPFATYRDRVGLSTIGLAISEPFFALVAVGGQQRYVTIQLFERRVLTFTPSNPETFRVEMGNVGQHYYQWRYPTGLPLTTSTQPTASPAPTGSAGVMLGGTRGQDFTDTNSHQTTHSEYLDIGPNETSKIITLTNASGAAIAFTAQTFASLTVTPSSGSIPPGQTVQLTVIVDRSTAKAGTAIALSINAGSSQITVTVHIG